MRVEDLCPRGGAWSLGKCYPLPGGLPIGNMEMEVRIRMSEANRMIERFLPNRTSADIHRNGIYASSAYAQSVDK